MHHSVYFDMCAGAKQKTNNYTCREVWSEIRAYGAVGGKSDLAAHPLVHVDHDDARYSSIQLSLTNRLPNKPRAQKPTIPRSA